jgi:hypothetical protein
VKVLRSQFGVKFGGGKLKENIFEKEEEVA